MKKLYIIVSALLASSVLLFVAAFIYLDKEGHRIYHYVINLDGYNVGAIRIDKFVTGDKLIYKSASSVPFYPILTESKSRIVLDRNHTLESYSKDSFGKGARESIYLENKENLVSFVATFKSKFAHLSNIPIRKETFIFEEDSPVTYLLIIENYDFRKGRAQGFNAISHLSTFLPPMKRYVTLTSIRDEYLKIDSRRIKTECLLLKIKNYPQGMVWVSKSDRSLIAVAIPDRGFKIIRTLTPTPVEAKEHLLRNEGYITKDLSFKNKNLKLSGTLTIPNKEGKFPLALLIWGSGPQDRQYNGLFISIADYLSRHGFCVFSFDKRGIGSSEGDFSSTTDADEIEDLNASLEFLAAQNQIDPQKIILIGHSEGAIHASELASKKDIVRAIILMAPSTSSEIKVEDLEAMALKFKWSGDYLKLAMRSNLETMNRVKGTKNNWTSILGKRCFLKRMREELDERPLDIIKEVKAPVLILQGKEDDPATIEFASTLDKALEETGNVNRSLTYFGYLGHWFGKKTNDGAHKIHYEVDSEVLGTIKNWLDAVAPAT